MAFLSWPIRVVTLHTTNHWLVTKTCYYLENQVFGGIKNWDMSLIETCFCWQLSGKQNMMLDVGWYWNTWCFIYSDVNSGKTKRQKLMQNYFYLKVPSLHTTNCVVKRESVFSACIPCQKNKISGGYSSFWFISVHILFI